MILIAGLLHHAFRVKGLSVSVHTFILEKNAILRRFKDDRTNVINGPSLSSSHKLIKPFLYGQFYSHAFVYTRET